jgi:pimeloyl-ACP methyl ester carboxylesterase
MQANTDVRFVPRLRLAAVVLLFTGCQASKDPRAIRSAEVVGGNVERRCVELKIPVTVTGVPGAYIFARHCNNAALPTPTTVHFLVHGSTHNNLYADWPEDPQLHSYVQAALGQGHATLAIDRLGSGWSTKPPSEMVTLATLIDVLHQLVQKLRNGEVGSYSKVIYHGTSLTTAYGWVLGDTHPNDIDGFVHTGLLHFTRFGWIGSVFTEFLYPACVDPKWNFLDCGYLTTQPNTRRVFFMVEENATESTLRFDDELRDVFSATLAIQSVPLVFDVVNNQPAVPVETAAGKTITKPVLVAIGEFDKTACSQDGTPQDGILCSSGAAAVKAFEQQYYPLTDIDVYVQPNSGHAINLHKNSKAQLEYVMNWARRNGF